MAFTNSSLATYSNTNHKDYTVYSDRKIDKIIVHHWGGVIATAKQGADYFATSTRKVSSNYVIGNDGSIALSVPEAYRAWTTGSAKADKNAITIETSNAETKNWTVSDKAYNSLVNLIADVCKRNGITKLEKGKNLFGHRDYAATVCPGDYLYGKLPEIATKVNAILNPVKTTTASTTASTKKSTTEIAKEVIAGKWGNGITRRTKLKKAGYDYATIQAEVNRLLKK